MKPLLVESWRVFHSTYSQQPNPRDMTTDEPSFESTVLRWFAPASAAAMSMAFGALCVMLVLSAIHERLVGEVFLPVGHSTMVWGFVILCLIAFATGTRICTVLESWIGQRSKPNPNSVPMLENGGTRRRSRVFSSINCIQLSLDNSSWVMGSSIMVAHANIVIVVAVLVALKNIR